MIVLFIDELTKCLTELDGLTTDDELTTDDAVLFTDELTERLTVDGLELTW